jgi:pyruvate/2-oxoglutarate dehydrogenase complex dihydrolipoamide dehydrogenase (E3) component
VTDSFDYDVIVIGAGPAGETAASRLCEAGMRSALVERELVGGECAYWACIPSKTLLRPPEVRAEADRAPGTDAPQQHWDAIASYRDFMIRNLDDSNEIKSYEERGVRVIKGRASFVEPGRVRVGEEVLTGERIVIATGSETSVPDIPGLAKAGYWTNREATTIAEVPSSVCVLGGGPVGIELAQMLARFGADVHLVEHQNRLLAREDPRISELILDALRDDGIDLHLGAEASRVTNDDSGRTVEFGGQSVRAEQLLVATSRRPRLEGLELERIGIEPGPHGIEVDERCRAAEGVWAIGDVTGAHPFTHVAMYQGRVACADILGQPASADYASVPRTVFCDPEVAAVGLDEQKARSAGIDAVSARIELRDAISRPWTYETEPRGELTVIADRERRVLVGAWAVAPLASEWIHYAALAIKAHVPLEVLTDTVAQFPTYCEAYLKALERLELN